MTARSLPFTNVAKCTLSGLVEALDPVKEAFLSKWARRRWRKVGPKEIVLAVLSVVLSAGASYSRISRALGIPALRTVSRQAVHKRMNRHFTEYLGRLVSKALLNGMAGVAGGGGGPFGAFASVVLHD